MLHHRGLIRNASSRHPPPPPPDLMSQELCQSALTKLPRRFWGALRCECLRLSSLEPHGELAERSQRVLGVTKCDQSFPTSQIVTEGVREASTFS